MIIVIIIAAINIDINIDIIKTKVNLYPFHHTIAEIYHVIFHNSSTNHWWEKYEKDTWTHTFKEDVKKYKCGGFPNEKWSSADDKKRLKVICLKLMASPPAFIYRWGEPCVSKRSPEFIRLSSYIYKSEQKVQSFKFSDAILCPKFQFSRRWFCRTD